MVQHNQIDHSGITGVGFSYASNANAVASGAAGGAATTVSRGDHVHLGVRSLAHTSNTFSGAITLTASGSLGITSPTPGTFNLSAAVDTTSGGVAGGDSHGAWTDYTPSWTASGSAPAIGNGVMEGRYKSLDSKTYIIRIHWAAGSTTTFGTGDWSFSLPAGLTTQNSGKLSILAGDALDSGTIRRPMTGHCHANSTKVDVLVSDSGGVSSTVPWTWASGDEIWLSGIIEVA